MKNLYQIALQTVSPIKLKKNGEAGHVGCALETVGGVVFTGIKVNGTEYSLVTSSFSVGDTTTYCLLKNDGQIYVGTNAVADGENTIEISAEGYEDCTVTFTK